MSVMKERLQSGYNLLIVSWIYQSGALHASTFLASGRSSVVEHFIPRSRVQDQSLFVPGEKVNKSRYEGVTLMYSRLDLKLFWC